ncbi:MAG: universal stress protein [Thermodesulfobacteriota bacterium]
MKILFAADEQPYSAFALKEVSKLAMNTWADVTLLGILPSLRARPGEVTGPLPPAHPLNKALHRYRDDFLKSWKGGDSPYAPESKQYEWLPLQRGLWEEMLVSRGTKRDLKVRLRIGQAVPEILDQAKFEESDIIVLGCTGGSECTWQGSPLVPQKVVNDADCSVLLVKEEQPITRILACLDQSYISQDSLEMVNQMATLHGSRLQLIGLSQEGAMKKDVYRRLIEVGDYYEDRQIEVSTRLTEISEFESFITQEIKKDLLALWVGRKSLLDRFFPRDWVGRFVSKCPTSVLVMR